MAEPRGILIGLEPHQQYSTTAAGLDRIYGLVDSPAIGINFDTGNSYLGGEDPVAWLKHVKDRLVHLHAKDISVAQSDAERGQGDRHAGRLRLRRGRDRLAAGDRGLPDLPARHRFQRRVRHRGPSGPKREIPEGAAGVVPEPGGFWSAAIYRGFSSRPDIVVTSLGEAPHSLPITNRHTKAAMNRRTPKPEEDRHAPRDQSCILSSAFPEERGGRGGPAGARAVVGRRGGRPDAAEQPDHGRHDRRGPPGAGLQPALLHTPPDARWWPCATSTAGDWK